MPHRRHGPGRGPQSRPDVHHHPGGPGGPHRHRHALSSLADAASPDRLDAALALVVEDPRDRAFVARCILQEGPAHHRAASWALLTMAAAIAARVGATSGREGATDDVVVPLRLPPHIARSTDDDDGAFPLRVPMAPLRAVATSEREVEVLADALVDGPPHHALANAALVALFERILAALDALPPPPR